MCSSIMADTAKKDFTYSDFFDITHVFLFTVISGVNYKQNQVMSL
jgi:hypothetical protein